MKPKIVLFFLLFFASITLLFYILNRQMETDYNRRQRVTLEMEQSFNRMNEELNKTLINTEFQKIMLEDTLSNEVPLSKLASQSPLLIFRFSELNCSSCYETELFSLHDFFSTKNRQIAILGSYRERRHYIMFKRGNRIELPFYRIPHDAFDWTLEDYGSPYYFILHPDMTVSHIYIPDQVFPELNKQYLERVKNFLSD